MTHRPYPSPVRARHQVERGAHPVPESRIVLSPLAQRLDQAWAPFREEFQRQMSEFTAGAARLNRHPTPTPPTPGSNP